MTIEKRAEELLEYLSECSVKDEVRVLSEALRSIRREAFEEAADILKTWHIKKGGFGEIEHQIRELLNDTSI